MGLKPPKLGKLWWIGCVGGHGSRNRSWVCRVPQVSHEKFKPNKDRHPNMLRFGRCTQTACHLWTTFLAVPKYSNALEHCSFFCCEKVTGFFRDHLHAHVLLAISLPWGGSAPTPPPTACPSKWTKRLSVLPYLSLGLPQPLAWMLDMWFRETVIAAPCSLNSQFLSQDARKHRI